MSCVILLCLLHTGQNKLTNSQCTNYHCIIALKIQGMPVIPGLYLVLKLQSKHRKETLHEINRTQNANENKNKLQVIY